MPISSRGNNSIQPTNSRAVDTAKATIDSIIAIQNKRYDNAFQIQGMQVILYSKKKGGLQCLCQTKQSNNKSILDEDGNASPGTINQLLTGSAFGVVPYGTKQPKVFDVISTGDQPLQLSMHPASIYDEDVPTQKQPVGSHSAGLTTDEAHGKGRTFINDGFDDQGPVTGEGTMGDDLIEQVERSGFDSIGMGSTDISCPICFGTGYVGGFAVLNGCRLVLDSQFLATGAIVYSEEYVPPMEATAPFVVFRPVLFPRGAVALDSLKVFNNTKVVPAKFYVDGVQLTKDQDVLKACDGLAHVVSIEVLNVEKTFTHIEIQYNQSDKPTLFEFPKLNQNSSEVMLERTDPFSIIMSPVVPNIGNGDIITDSTYGKTMQVNTASWWNDKRRTVLGWECEVRPVQPQELFSILPKRRAMQSQNTMIRPGPNSDKKF